MKLNTQPVALGSAVIALITAVLPILLMLGVSVDVVEKIGISAPGLVIAIGAVVHNLVTPTSRVALTNDQAATLPKPSQITYFTTGAGSGGGARFNTGGVGGGTAGGSAPSANAPVVPLNPPEPPVAA